MPMVGFGETFSTGNSPFSKLKSQGEKIQFRLLGAPFIEGKHFFETADGWDIQPCPRVNSNSKCDHCDVYWSIMGKARKSGDKTVLKQAEKEAKPYQNSISVYYPVIDREKEKLVIFQTTPGVRKQIEEEYALGTKVLDIDWVVMRTETPGSYYRLSKVDSADTKKLTPGELEEVERFKTIDLAQYVGGAYDAESGVAFESNSEVLDEEPEV